MAQKPLHRSLIRYNLLFYSTNTYISYIINKQFYGQHFIWCSPVFNPSSLNKLNPFCNIPTSSSSHDIYNLYRSGVNSNDGHSPLIAQNRAGIKRGATFKLADGTITEHELQMINHKADKASISDFRPVVYLIPAALASSKINLFPVEEIANPLGTECRMDYSGLANGVAAFWSLA